VAEHPSGIEVGDLHALRDAVRAQHPRGGMQPSKSCACGAPGGGPAWTPACRAPADLVERSTRLRRLESEGGQP
jgi:hypothetical protein